MPLSAKRCYAWFAKGNTSNPNLLIQETLRNKGDKNEFKEQQDAEIMAAYRRIFKTYGGTTDVKTIYQMVSKAPASRFFVSERQACRVITAMANGQQPRMPEGKRRMYAEIYRRVQKELELQKQTTTLNSSFLILHLKNSVAKVIRQPAPEMYVGVRQISFIISTEKRKCYEERKRRLRHCF